MLLQVNLRMFCQFDLLMKNCFDFVMKVILVVIVILGSEVKVIRFDFKVFFQFFCVYGIYIEVFISEQVEELKMNKNWLIVLFYLVVEYNMGVLKFEKKFLFYRVQIKQFFLF